MNWSISGSLMSYDWSHLSTQTWFSHILVARVASHPVIPVMVHLGNVKSVTVVSLHGEGWGVAKGLWAEQASCFSDMQVWVASCTGRKGSSLPGRDGCTRRDTVMNEGGELQEPINQYLLPPLLFFQVGIVVHFSLLRLMIKMTDKHHPQPTLLISPRVQRNHRTALSQFFSLNIPLLENNDQL